MSTRGLDQMITNHNSHEISALSLSLEREREREREREMSDALARSLYV